MLSVLKQFAELVAILCEFAAVTVLALAALAAAFRLLLHVRRLDDLTIKKAIWLRFASSILVALEFALAADVARTVITPTWNELGGLAVIATIRTVLNIYLERDIEAYSTPQKA